VSECFETQFGPVIAEHWRQKFPDETKTLRAVGALEREADKRAVKAAFDLCSLRQSRRTRRNGVRRYRDPGERAAKAAAMMTAPKGLSTCAAPKQIRR
jgi:hypothetical protein